MLIIPEDEKSILRALLPETKVSRDVIASRDLGRLIMFYGGSGSGKTSLSHAIIGSLNLPWVVILSMDSFYKVLTPEQSAQAFDNNYDFDSPDALDFDILVEMLRDLKAG